jgi:hypothetical protein
LPLLAAAQTSDISLEEAIVKQTVESYLKKTGQNVLHPAAKNFSTDGTGKRLLETPINKPYKPKKGETIGQSLQYIVAVDITEDGVSVKVETEFPTGMPPAMTPRKHIQYVSLLKVNGEWKIVSILMPPLKFAQTAIK